MCNSQNVPDSLILKGPSISHIINTTVKKERKCVRTLKPFSFDLLQIFSLKFRGLASDTNNVSVKSNTILSTASYICCPEFQRQMQL